MPEIKATSPRLNLSLNPGYYISVLTTSLCLPLIQAKNLLIFSTVSCFLDRHKTQASPTAWVLQTCPQLSLSSESRSCLWNLFAPCTKVPISHSNCTSRGFFKKQKQKPTNKQKNPLYFLGQTFHKLLLHHLQLTILLGPTGTAQL